MKVTITSDGTPTGTRITDEHGNDLTQQVTAIRWEHRAGDLPRAEVDVMMLGLNEVGVAETRVLHAGREVRAIEYADGERVEYN